MEIRPARTSDIKGIRTLIDTYAVGKRLLTKETVRCMKAFKNLVLQ